MFSHAPKVGIRECELPHTTSSIDGSTRRMALPASLASLPVGDGVLVADLPRPVHLVADAPDLHAVGVAGPPVGPLGCPPGALQYSTSAARRVDAARAHVDGEHRLDALRAASRRGSRPSRPGWSRSSATPGRAGAAATRAARCRPPSRSPRRSCRRGSGRSSPRGRARARARRRGSRPRRRSGAPARRCRRTRSGPCARRTIRTLARRPRRRRTPDRWTRWPPAPPGTVAMRTLTSGVSKPWLRVGVDGMEGERRGTPGLTQTPGPGRRRGAGSRRAGHHDAPARRSPAAARPWRSGTCSAAATASA